MNEQLVYVFLGLIILVLTTMLAVDVWRLLN